MTINKFLNNVTDQIINPIILLLFALAAVYFVYSVIKFLTIDADDKGTARVEARNAIMWGIVGMVIMISVYGLIRFVLVSFGISVNDPSLSGAAPYLGQ